MTVCGWYRLRLVLGGRVEQLFTVGLSSVLAVTLDGDAAAVVVDEVSPLLMLALLALLFSTVGARSDLFASKKNSATHVASVCVPAGCG
jgi:hypothetical protein